MFSSASNQKSRIFEAVIRRAIVDEKEIAEKILKLETLSPKDLLWKLDTERQAHEKCLNQLRIEDPHGDLAAAEAVQDDIMSEIGVLRKSMRKTFEEQQTPAMMIVLAQYKDACLQRSESATDWLMISEYQEKGRLLKEGKALFVKSKQRMDSAVDEIEVILSKIRELTAQEVEEASKKVVN